MVTFGVFCFLAVMTVQVATGASKTCYDGCICTPVFELTSGIVNCTDVSLHGVPEELLVDTYVLIINNDYIPTVKENSFYYESASEVHILSLQKNNISKLEQLAFIGLTQLEALYLSQNVIATLGPNVFRGLNNVIKLGLTDNEISVIDIEAFQGMGRLTTLYLAGNHIRSLDPDVFRHNLQLSELSLSDNFQLFLPSDKPFLNTTSLRVLNMSYCGYEELPSTTFEGTPNLQQIDLANNYLTNGPYSFHNLPNLTVLNLEENGIETLDHNEFGAFQNLKILHLNGNKIRSLHPHTFQANSKLTVLNLNSNELITLDTGLFLPLTNLLELDLRSNPFSCDCRLQAVYVWCLHQNVTTKAECKSGDGTVTLPWSSLGKLNCAGESSVYVNSYITARPTSDLQRDTLLVSSWNMYMMIVVCTFVFILLGMFFAYIRRRYKQSSTPTAYDVSAASEAGGTYNNFQMGEVTSVIMNSNAATVSDSTSLHTITPQSTLSTRYSRSPAYFADKICGKLNT